MMVTHIVIFTWIAGVNGVQVEEFRQALNQLALEMREIAVMRHGSDLHFRGTNGDYALLATFADKASWDTYQAHPSHKAFVRDFVTPLQASRVAIQF
jgi:hypothetical protein